MNTNTLQIKVWIGYLYSHIVKQSHNFRLCSTWIDSQGEVHFSKWRHYLDANGDDAFLARCNQREQLLNEVVLDLDDGDFQELIARLKKDNVIFFAYQTASGRARHIHTYWRGLVTMPKHLREEVREKIIRKYGCDPAFKTDSHMIPLENCPHWKTGEMKELILKHGGDYDF